MKKTLFLVICWVICTGTTANSAPIQTIDQTTIFHFRSFQGTSSTGLRQGDSLFFGLIGFEPDYTNGTTGSANQNGTTRNLTPCADVNAINGLCTGVEYDASLVGSWQLQFQNESDTLVLQTQSVGDVPLPERPTDFRLTAEGSSFSFAWSPVVGADNLQFDVWDLENRVSENGLAQKIGEFVLPTGATSFTIPESFELKENHLYSVSINADKLRTNSGTDSVGGQIEGSLHARSRTFFEFSTGALPEGEDIFLPEVSTTDGNPVFNFNNSVIANTIAFYDPIVAIGYDYMIGVGDPLFNSVSLPEIGDDIFDLYLWDGTEYLFQSSIGSGNEYFFDGSGVDRFRILGIETGAFLDPTDPTAFVTGLSFVADGQFTGTMMPITEFVAGSSPVPLPATGWMLLAGIGGLVAARKKSQLG